MNKEGKGERLLNFLGRGALYETKSNLVGVDYLLSDQKRKLDFWGSRVMLLCGAGELVGIGAGAIALANRFPPFTRIEGPNGSSRLKLQTMRPGAQNDEEAILKNHTTLMEWAKLGDPRLTQTGRIIRKTSIDELPTLFDVAKGKMFLVGPKMLTKAEYQYHVVPNATVEPYTAYIHFLEKEGVKYGFLGPYILRGRRGREYLERVKEDVEYCQKASLASDYRLIMLNALAVLVYRGK